MVFAVGTVLVVAQRIDVGLDRKAGLTHQYLARMRACRRIVAQVRVTGREERVMLEETDGWALYEQLQGLTQAPIVFITAWRTGENRRKAEALRADGFLAKPISHQDFAAVLQRVVGKPARRLSPEGT